MASEVISGGLFGLDRYAPFVLWVYVITALTLLAYLIYLFVRLHQERDQ